MNVSMRAVAEPVATDRSVRPPYGPQRARGPDVDSGPRHRCVGNFSKEEVATARDLCRLPPDRAAAVTGLGGESGGGSRRRNNENGGYLAAPRRGCTSDGR